MPLPAVATVEQPIPVVSRLKQRHLQLLAIGGVIGAGFFLGSGIAISQAGPALLLAYLITGAIIYLILRALGELTLAYPAAGSFSTYATQFIGPLAGFITGWSYWLMCTIGGIAEISGVALLLHHWYPATPQWITALCAAILLYAINMTTVRSFGEFEYWLSMIKVVTIIGVTLCGIAILVFKIGDAGSHAAVSNLWVHGGFLPKGISGLLTALSIVISSYAGIEVIGLASAETEDPERTLPSAINSVFFRVLLFYFGSFAVIMMLYPWALFNPRESPFVLVLAHAGLPTAAGLVTFVAIAALLSTCNTAIFATSRMLTALAAAGHAPASLRALNKRNIPYTSVTVSGIILIVGVVLNYLIPDQVLTYALTMITWVILWTWAVIAISHLLYRRSVSLGNVRAVSFRLPGAPYTNWVILLAIGIIAVMLAINGSTRITFYLLVAWFGILLAAYYRIIARQQTRQ